MKKIFSLQKTDLLTAVAVLAAIVSCVYLLVRSVLYGFSDYGWTEKCIGLILLMAEGFVVVHGAGYAMNVYKVSRQKQALEDGDLLAEQQKCAGPDGPSVAILVPARNEPREVLESTFITINNINYRNKTVYFLDDSTQESFRAEAEELARDYHLRLFRRTKPWHGAKAGIVNDCLETLTEDYVAVFDADQNPMPKFLSSLVPFLARNPGLAFVQTPQFYSNIQHNPIARAATLQQAVFYEYICEGKGLEDSMFCCGTNVVFRARALREVGGFDESSVTEDFATSLKLHILGWRSLYYGHVYAFGAGPETLRAYFQQQFRWAAGTLGVFKKVLAAFLRAPNALKPFQWLEYFLSSTYYFVGLAFYILMLCPIIYLVFGIPSFFARPGVYFFAFLPYIILSLTIFYVALRQRNYKVKDLFLGQLLGVLAITVYIRAALTAILGVKISFGVTPKGREARMPYLRLWPQLGLLTGNFMALVWGMNRFYYEQDLSLLVNSFWGLYHFLLLTSIFYFNREASA
jgi:cellulose synthase (UDP-forming)